MLKQNGVKMKKAKFLKYGTNILAKLNALKLCTNYNDAKDTMLDSISISSQDSRMKIYTFLRRTGLFYE
jgi:hypothetical protein